jgi:hypothetical protein
MKMMRMIMMTKVTITNIILKSTTLSSTERSTLGLTELVLLGEMILNTKRVKMQTSFRKDPETLYC